MTEEADATQTEQSRLHPVISQEEAGYVSHEDFVEHISSRLSGSSTSQQDLLRANWNQVIQGKHSLAEAPEHAAWPRLEREIHWLSFCDHVRGLEELVDSALEGNSDVYSTLFRVHDIYRRCAEMYLHVHTEVFIRNQILRNKLSTANRTRTVCVSPVAMKSGAKHELIHLFQRKIENLFPISLDPVSFPNLELERREALAAIPSLSGSISSNSRGPGDTVVAGRLVRDNKHTFSVRPSGITFVFPKTERKVLQRYISYLTRQINKVLSLETVIKVDLRHPGPPINSIDPNVNPEAIYDGHRGPQDPPEPLVVRNSSLNECSNVPNMWFELVIELTLPNNSNPVPYSYMQQLLQILTSLRRKQLCTFWTS